MYGDAYKDPSHAEMQQLIWRRVATFADYANVEHRLSNKKIADVYYQCGATIIIVEVKTILKDTLITDAWRKYHSHCNYLVIACPPQPRHDDCGSLVAGWVNEQLMRVGIWWVDWSGIRECRPACRLDTKMPGRMVRMAPALAPFTVIGSPACTVSEF